MKKNIIVLTGVLVFNWVFLSSVFASNWVTNHFDSRRSGITRDEIRVPFVVNWERKEVYAPTSAWGEPAHKDIWNHVPMLSPAMTYDRCFQPVVADGRVFYGSSTDDTLFCLSCGSGRELWRFTTGGPIRLAPVVFGNRVLVASDDGCVYCLSVKTGKVLWQSYIGTERWYMAGNNRMISKWPVRGGLAVWGNRVYCSAGVFPREKVFLCALDIKSGKKVWCVPVGLAAQGNISVTESCIFLPSGRTGLHIFDRKSGKEMGKVDGGGCYAVAYKDMIVQGCNEKGQLAIGSVERKETLVKIRGQRLLADGNFTYVLDKNALYALDRQKYLQLSEEIKVIQVKIAHTKNRKIRNQLKKSITPLSKQRKKCRLWGVKCPLAFEMIKAGKHIIVGGEDMVIVFDTKSGKEVFRHEVKGRVYGLAVSDNRLYASTNRGYIYCFKSGKGKAIVKRMVNKRVKWGTNKESFELKLPAQVRDDGIGNVLLYAYGNFKNSYKIRIGKDVDKMGIMYPLLRWNDKIWASLDSLEPSTRYYYQFVDKSGKATSMVFHFRTGAIPFQNPQRISKMVLNACKFICDNGGRANGYVVILNDNDGRLAYALAKNSAFQIVVINNGSIDKIRRKFQKLGLNGTRIMFLRNRKDLRIQHYSANIIVDASALYGRVAPKMSDRIFNALRPEGGTIFIPHVSKQLVKWTKDIRLTSLSRWTIKQHLGLYWSLARRGILPNTGKWTHLYANPSNDTCSGETYDTEAQQIQWYGRPGPRKMVDRHHRAMAPIYNNGLLFTLGFNYMYGIDAYNGTILWERSIAKSTRFGIMHDTGVMATAGNRVYVASGERCLALDVKSGLCKYSYKLPGKSAMWGGVAVIGNRLFGTKQKNKITRVHGLRRFIGTIERDFSPKAISSAIFAYNRETKRLLWNYNNRTIINATLCYAKGNIYFIETRNPALATTSKKPTLPTLLEKDAYVVAISQKTGKKIWEKNFEYKHIFQHVLFLEYSDNVLLISGTYNSGNGVVYDMRGLNPDTGKKIWEKIYRGGRKNGAHGEQWQHPVIANGKIVIMRGMFDLHSGAELHKAVAGWRLGGHGCGTISGSASRIYFRGANPYCFDYNKNEGHALNSVSRPGCWINILPVGGLILIPEASSGCTCHYSIQTSMAFSTVKDK